MKRYTRIYSLFGLAAGLLFPLLACLTYLLFRLSAEFLFIIIFFAPLVLSVAGYITGKSRDRLETLNADLDTAVSYRTNALQNMLDISGQAIFTFDTDFLIQNEYSSVCEDFFGRKIEHQDVRLLLFDNQRDRDDFTQGIELLFTGRAQSEVVFELFDETIQIDERLAEVHYRFLSPDRVLVGLTDQTEELALQQRIAREERGKEMIFTAVSHQAYFRDLLREAEDVFFYLDSVIASGTQATERIQSLQRKLHTFRGNLSFFHFVNTHQLVDELETYISDMLNLEQALEFRGQGLALKRIYFQELRSIVDTLGEDWLHGVDAVQVPRRQFQQLLSYIREQYRNDQNLISSLENFYKVPMRTLFSQYPHMVKTIASRLGKRVEPMRIIGGDFSVLPDTYRNLSNAAIHIIRNMVDHGIEMPFEREAAGKQAAGIIQLRISRDTNAMQLRFQDDGSGIDFEAVERKARDRGLIAAEREPDRNELTKLLFRSGFSTAGATGVYSGKGVGLSALRHAVKLLGGSIQVKTQATKGTTFRIIIPLQELET